MKKIFVVIITSCMCFSSMAQRYSQLEEQAWVDSVFSTLNETEKLGQLMIVRLSSIDASRKVTFYDSAVQEAIHKYNIGGICLFQGGPVTQAEYVNRFQAIAKTPVLISIDAENGLGMRMDSVVSLPRQMMMGAVQDPQQIYEYGKWVGEQCRRAGIQVNYAPVADINNNPDNPVINDRSFGENKYKVAEFAVNYMRGMQDMGILACAKHFPGHGDVAVDSHLDLPVINKSREQLDTLELFPFKELFKAGVGSAMIAHLYIPAIDNMANRATSLSYKNVTKLLREDLDFKGLVFTDALEMQGVKQFFPDGKASVESLIAGNDMLCLPGDIEDSIDEIKKAIRRRKLSWKQIDERVKKILHVKYQLGLHQWQPVKTKNLLRDLNLRTPAISRSVAEHAITALRLTSPIIPLLPVQERPDEKAKSKIAFLGLGLERDNTFARLMRGNYDADVFYFNYREAESRIDSLATILESGYDKIILGIHYYNRFPANNFGISTPAIQLARRLQSLDKTISFVFGNPYAIRNFCEAKNIVACYEDNFYTHQAAAAVLNGSVVTKGKLPVTVCDVFTYGSGINSTDATIQYAQRDNNHFNRFTAIDSIATQAIEQRATPGMAILAVKDGRIIFHKAYGYFTYDSTEKVNLESIYDLASVTKICATTMSVMRLYDQGKLDIKKTLGDYLPWVRGSDKEKLRIDDILLHQAGLKAFITFYKETIDTITGMPLPGFYDTVPSPQYRFQVADTMYLRTSWEDTIFQRILESPLAPTKKYIYSDNDFIFLGKIVEAISGMPLNKYVYTEFYRKLGLTTTGFLPLQRFPEQDIVPTEYEQTFRRQLLHGTVHDPGAALFGGVAGHAGLFSDAYDLAVLMQMVLNGGEFNGYRFFSPETIQLFTAYGSKISRRGLGFDKPEKDNATSNDPYPCKYASPLTFGHTGFTGTCVWVDPKYNLIYIFLSNRVNPDGGSNMKLIRTNVRSNIHDAIYEAIRRNGK